VGGGGGVVMGCVEVSSVGVGQAKTKKSGFVGLGSEKLLCGSKLVSLVCKDKLHYYAKKIRCNRDWCPNCRKIKSDAHMRRAMRIIDKVFWLGSMGEKGDKGISYGLGYFVFNIPYKIRPLFKDQKNLYRAGRALQEFLRKSGFEFGIRRWHFFGNVKADRGGEFDMGYFHPHLNVLVPGKWCDGKDDLPDIDDIKKAWRKILEGLSDRSIGEVDVHYHYFGQSRKVGVAYLSKLKIEPTKERLDWFQTVGYMGAWYHKAFYVVRPTILSLKGNKSLVNGLFNFHNTVIWGFKQGKEKEERESLGRMELERFLKATKQNGDFEWDRDSILRVNYLSKKKCPGCAEIGYVTDLVAGRVKTHKPIIEVVKVKNKVTEKVVGWYEAVSVKLYDCDDDFLDSVLTDFGGGYYEVIPDPSIIVTVKPKSSVKKDFGGSGNHDPPRIDQFKFDFVKNRDGLIH